MNAPGFPRNRYDPVKFELAFAAAEFILKRGKVYAILPIDDDEIEVLSSFQIASLVAGAKARGRASV